MKAFSRIVSVLILMTGAAGMTFAAGSAENYNLALSVSSVGDQTTIGSIEVPATAEVRQWFQSHGVDGSKIDAPLGTLNQSYKNAVADLLADSDRRDQLAAIVTPALKAALVRGQIEVATMHTGRTTWTLSIDGPEDNDDE